MRAVIGSREGGDLRPASPDYLKISPKKFDMAAQER